MLDPGALATLAQDIDVGASAEVPSANWRNCERSRLPRWIALAEGDNEWIVDLDNPYTVGADGRDAPRAA